MRRRELLLPTFRLRLFRPEPPPGRPIAAITAAITMIAAMPIQMTASTSIASLVAVAHRPPWTPIASTVAPSVGGATGTGQRLEEALRSA
jgi:hypothetical protein